MPHRFPDRRLAPLYAQPFEVGLACILIVTGWWMAVEPSATPGSIADLRWPWTILFQGVMVAGGILVILGALPQRRWSRALEQVGMICMGTVFSTYAVGLYQDGNPSATLAMITYAVVAVCSFLKAWTLWLEAKIKLRELKRLPMTSMFEGN